MVLVYVGLMLSTGSLCRLVACTARPTQEMVKIGEDDSEERLQLRERKDFDQLLEDIT